MKELDDIDQLFQTTFEGFELTPDASAKTYIDRAIASKTKRRRLLFILFPIVFGTSILAAIAYFYPGSGKSTSEGNFIAQNHPNEQKHSSQFSEISEQKTVTQTAAVSTKNQTKSITQKEFKSTTTALQNASVKTQAIKQTKIKKTLEASNNPSSSNLVALANEPTVQSLESKSAIVLPDGETQEKTESKTAKTDPKDSITASSSSDSSELKDLITSAEMPAFLPDVKKGTRKWSLSLINGWENETKKRAESFDSTELSGASKEYARIHSTSFYGKIEFNRKISNDFDLLVGLGFHSGKITQYGSLYSLDSFPIFENVSSVPVADTFGYFIQRKNETLIYQVNSILLPLGISYSTPLGANLRFRLSGGTQLSYGWMKEKLSNPHLSTPKFNAFGLNVWVRPEIHYTFGKFQLFGFGTFNQPLLKQLKWDFTVRRNPAFGAGIGLMIQL